MQGTEKRSSRGERDGQAIAGLIAVCLLGDEKEEMRSCYI